VDTESKVVDTCHICGELAEYPCAQCEELTCEDCVVQFTLHNQCEEWRCDNCESSYQVDRAEEYWEEERVDELIKDLGYDGYLIHEELTRQLKKENNDKKDN